LSNTSRPETFWEHVIVQCTVQHYTRKPRKADEKLDVHHQTRPNRLLRQKAAAHNKIH